MHAPFRFIDGLGEDMLGYIFPSGNAVGIPTPTNLNPSDTDRFGCGHSDDSEADLGRHAADIVGRALVRVLDTHEGRAETIVHGRYVLPGGALSRDPLGGPVAQVQRSTLTFTAARHPARSVRLASTAAGDPERWMSLSGLPAARAGPRHARLLRRPRARVWLDVFQ